MTIILIKRERSYLRVGEENDEENKNGHRHPEGDHSGVERGEASEAIVVGDQLHRRHVVVTGDLNHGILLDKNGTLTAIPSAARIAGIVVGS